jgi:hypothetical protein
MLERGEDKLEKRMSIRRCCPSRPEQPGALLDEFWSHRSHCPSPFAYRYLPVSLIAAHAARDLLIVFIRSSPSTCHSPRSTFIAAFVERCCPLIAAPFVAGLFVVAAAFAALSLLCPPPPYSLPPRSLPSCSLPPRSSPPHLSLHSHLCPCHRRCRLCRTCTAPAC